MDSVVKQKDLFTKRYREVKRREPLEDQIQAAVIAHMKWRGRDGVMYFAIPNGGYRWETTGGRLKAMGVRPGVADLQFIWSEDNIARVLFLELKRPGGKQSPVQHEFEIDCGKVGAIYRIAYDLDEALEVLKGYGILK